MFRWSSRPQSLFAGSQAVRANERTARDDGIARRHVIEHLMAARALLLPVGAMFWTRAHRTITWHTSLVARPGERPAANATACFIPYAPMRISVTVADMIEVSVVPKTADHLAAVRACDRTVRIPTVNAHAYLTGHRATFFLRVSTVVGRSRRLPFGRGQVVGLGGHRALRCASSASSWATRASIAAIRSCQSGGGAASSVSGSTRSAKRGSRSIRRATARTA